MPCDTVWIRYNNAVDFGSLIKTERKEMSQKFPKYKAAGAKIRLWKARCLVVLWKGNTKMRALSNSVPPEEKNSQANLNGFGQNCSRLPLSPSAKGSISIFIFLFKKQIRQITLFWSLTNSALAPPCRALQQRTHFQDLQLMNCRSCDASEFSDSGNHRIRTNEQTLVQELLPQVKPSRREEFEQLSL